MGQLTELRGWNVVVTALEHVGAEYGDHYDRAVMDDGIPDPVQWLPFHNRAHSAEVHDHTTLIAGRLGLSSSMIQVARMAGAAHAVVQQGTPVEMKTDSADWLEVRMDKQGFGRKHIAAARLAVLGTEPVIEDGAMIGQMVWQQDYPSKDAEKVARAVAAADMAYLYAPSGPLRRHALFQELCAKSDPGYRPKSPADAPPLEGLLDFQEETLRLATDYTYPVGSAERKYGAYRPRVVTYHQLVLRQLVSGEIENWEQLRIQDLKFKHKLATV